MLDDGRQECEVDFFLREADMMNERYDGTYFIDIGAVDTRYSYWLLLFLATVRMNRLQGFDVVEMAQHKST